MTAKEFLSRAEDITYKINVRESMLIEKHSRLRYKGISYDDTNTKRNASQTEQAYVSIADFEKKVNKEIIDLEKQLNEIRAVILQVSDGKQAYVLNAKFIEGKSLEKIAEEIHYSTRQTVRLYNLGLAAVTEIIKNVTKCH